MKRFPKADYPIGARVKVLTVWNAVVDGIITDKRTYDDEYEQRVSYDVQIDKDYTSTSWVTCLSDPFAEAAARGAE